MALRQTRSEKVNHVTVMRKSLLETEAVRAKGHGYGERIRSSQKPNQCHRH